MPADVIPMLSHLLMTVLGPAMVFHSLLRPFEAEFLHESLVVAALGLGLYLGLTGLSLAAAYIFRVSKNRRGTWAICVAFPNNGFMGFPVALALFGEEGLTLTVILSIPFNLLMYSVGAKMVCMDLPRDGSAQAISWGKVIFSVINLSLVVGLVFKAMLHPSTGFLNILLKFVGLEALARDWLGSIDTAFGTIICVDVWKGVGYGMVIFIAGLQAISREYYEAAEIDGAGFWAKVKNVMLPFLLPTITVNIVLSISYGLRVFDIVYVLTNGGPGYATDVMNTVVFSEFSSGNYAMGSTVATLLALLTLAVSIAITRTVNRKEVY